MAFDFETTVAREGTDAVKVAMCKEKFGATDLLPMWVADMDFACPPFLVEALKTRLEHPIYGYTIAPESTYAAVCNWQSRRHKWATQKSWVILAPGVVPCLGFCVQGLTNPGDEVAMFTPVYDPFFGVVERAGRKVLRSPMSFNGERPRVDLEAFEAQITPRTRLVFLCNPHNPGGMVWQRSDLEELARIAEAHDLIVVSDEIHADLVFDPHVHIPFASVSNEASERTITLSSPAKSFNVPGLAGSYAIVENPALRKTLREVMDQFYFYGPNLFGIRAIEEAYTHGDDWISALKAVLQTNLQLAVDAITEHTDQITVHRPDGTYLLWLDCRAAFAENPNFGRDLIEKAKLGLTPGSQFGPEGEGFMRMNVAAPTAVVEEGVRRLLSIV